MAKKNDDIVYLIEDSGQPMLVEGQSAPILVEEQPSPVLVEETTAKPAKTKRKQSSGEIEIAKSRAQEAERLKTQWLTRSKIADTNKCCKNMQTKKAWTSTHTKRNTDVLPISSPKK